MCSAQNSQDATSKTWSRALMGYFLFPSAFSAVSLAGAIEPPGILAIGLNIVLLPLSFVSLVFFYGILWFYMASLFLGAIASVSSSVRIVGNAYFIPAIIGTLSFFVVLMGRLNPYQTDSDLERMSRSVIFIIGLWGVFNVVRAAKRENSFGAKQVVVFVLWFLPIWWVVSYIRRFLLLYLAA